MSSWLPFLFDMDGSAPTKPRIVWSALYNQNMRIANSKLPENVFVASEVCSIILLSHLSTISSSTLP